MCFLSFMFILPYFQCRFCNPLPPTSCILYHANRAASCHFELMHLGLFVNVCMLMLQFLPSNNATRIRDLKGHTQY